MQLEKLNYTVTLNLFQGLSLVMLKHLSVRPARSSAGRFWEMRDGTKP